ncbi:MAG: hypothetical protein V2J14_03065 [Erythrobacter sp.]|jgi:hypothetical protein|nr:hypothetical protein [Erythrobacter sp.]
MSNNSLAARLVAPIGLAALGLALSACDPAPGPMDEDPNRDFGDETMPMDDSAAPAMPTEDGMAADNPAPPSPTPTPGAPPVNPILDDYVEGQAGGEDVPVTSSGGGSKLQPADPPR